MILYIFSFRASGDPKPMTFKFFTFNKKTVGPI